MRVAFYTLGCKVNQYETEVLSARFAAEGFDVVPGHAPGCDVYVVGSCTVTAEGDRKTRQAVRRFRRENPGAIVVLTGCYPQAFPREAAAVTEADIITGARNRAALPQLVKDFSLDHQRVVNIPKHEKGEDFEACSAADFGVRTRAFLKIQDGCDNWCSYCIIPAARGPVRSKPMPELQSELLTLAQNGYREIVLTGINLSNYGREWGLHLSDAVLAAAATPGVERVRLGSIEPDLLTPQEIYRLAEGCGGKLCPQFHLALQSGCDATLRRMNRHYTARQYLETVEGIRRRFSNPSVTTDLIAGFPGETEAEFEECCRTVEAAGLLRGHVFEYSPRAGTAAAALPDQVPPAVKKERAKALVRLCRESGRAFAQTQVGRTARVLLEATGGGYTDNYLYVQVFPPGQVPHGAGGWIDVRLDRVVEGGCHGIPINTDCKTEKENEDGGISCFH